MAKKNRVQSILAALALSASIDGTVTAMASADSPNGPVERASISSLRVHANGDLYVMLASGYNACGSNTYLAGNVGTSAAARAFLSLAQAAYLSGKKVTIWTGACNGENGTIEWMAAL